MTFFNIKILVIKYHYLRRYIILYIQGANYLIFIEFFQIIISLPDSKIKYRLCGGIADRYCSPSLVINIKLAQDNAIDSDNFIESVNLLNQIITCNALSDKYLKVWLCNPVYLFKLLHQVFIVVLPSCSVNQDNVQSLCLCMFYPVIGNSSRISAVIMSYYMNSKLFSVLFQLLD